MAKMTPHLWTTITHFDPEENWGNPDEMNVLVVRDLDRLREYVGLPIHVHCGFERRITGGYHYYGMAVDFDIEGLSLIDQYFAAARFDGFNGIGLYPYWKTPGLHVDCRGRHQQFFVDARWISTSKGVYIPLDEKGLRRIML